MTQLTSSHPTLSQKRESYSGENIAIPCPVPAITDYDIVYHLPQPNLEATATRTGGQSLAGAWRGREDRTGIQTRCAATA